MGYKAPLTKNMGIIRKLIIRLKLSRERIREAISTPKEERAKDIITANNKSAIT